LSNNLAVKKQLQIFEQTKLTPHVLTVNNAVNGPAFIINKWVHLMMYKNNWSNYV